MQIPGKAGTLHELLEGRNNIWIKALYSYVWDKFISSEIQEIIPFTILSLAILL